MGQISNVSTAKYQEAEQKRQGYEVKKAQMEHYQAYQNTVKNNEKELDRLKNDYDSKITFLEKELEQKLIDAKVKQTDRVKQENERLEAELKDLRQAHQDQVAQIKESQQYQIDKMNESHKTTMQNGKERFMRDQMKLNT